MELGNLIFGNSRGLYCFPDRNLVNSYEWETLKAKAKVNSYGWSEVNREVKGFENDIFAIRPYYWGNCTCGADYSETDEEHSKNCELVLPNFLYKPTEFTIDWYKYPFRDSYMNKDLTIEEVLNIFRKCIESITD